MKDEYAFEGVVIRLKQKDYDKWLKNFKNIPNLDAVLMSRDVWLSEEAENARFKDKNKKDEQGRRLGEDGKHIFKRMP